MTVNPNVGIFCGVLHIISTTCLSAFDNVIHTLLSYHTVKAQLTSGATASRAPSCLENDRERPRRLQECRSSLDKAKHPPLLEIPGRNGRNTSNQRITALETSEQVEKWDPAHPLFIGANVPLSVIAANAGSCKSRGSPIQKAKETSAFSNRGLQLGLGQANAKNTPPPPAA